MSYPGGRSSDNRDLPRKSRDDVYGKEDPVQALNKEIQGATDIMRQNIAITLERGEDLNVLGSRTDELVSSTSQFHANSKAAKHKMWFRNVKLMIAIAIVCIVILALIRKPVEQLPASRAR